MLCTGQWRTAQNCHLSQRQLCNGEQHTVTQLSLTSATVLCSVQSVIVRSANFQSVILQSAKFQSCIFQSVIVQSCNFYSCDFVRNFPLLQCPILQCCPSFSSPAVSSPAHSAIPTNDTYAWPTPRRSQKDTNNDVTVKADSRLRFTMPRAVHRKWPQYNQVSVIHGLTA